MRRTQSLTWIAALLVLLLAGCGGTGSSPPAGVGSVAPASVNFGNVVVGATSSAQSVAYQNVGSGPLAITAISAGGDYAESNNCGSSLAGGAACNINVTFTPTTTGTSNGTLQITGESPQNVSLSGMGVNMHNVLLSWTPSTSPVLGYIVFRSDQPIGPFTPVNGSPTPAITFTDQVPGGQNWYYFVAAVNASLTESLPSNEVQAVVPP